MSAESQATKKPRPTGQGFSCFWPVPTIAFKAGPVPRGLQPPQLGIEGFGGGGSFGFQGRVLVCEGFDLGLLLLAGLVEHGREWGVVHRLITLGVMSVSARFCGTPTSS